jgi:hypothetical protein
MSSDDSDGRRAEQSEGAAGPPGEDAPEPFEDEDEPRITLDRYFSRRRPSPRMGWAQVVSMIAMLVGLLLIVFYKDQCGGLVGRFMNQVAPGEQSTSTPSPPVRYQLDE